ncbi:MAG: hypothetical protein D6690_13680 [Nitrospirae bacterium]|nr:MAG: hypothetical protein D6690_13680 [Nitrospirota bacterium]
MALKKLYIDIYQRFLELRDSFQGYEFHHSRPKSVAPPSPTFRERLTWWTLNRPRRLKTIRKERDRRQQEILSLKDRLRSS